MPKTTAAPAPEQFRRWLNAGLGRVYLVADQYGLEPYREVILDSLEHNRVYDRQLNDNTDFLYELVDRSDDRRFYRDQVLTALRTATDGWDAEQLFDLAERFAEHGDDGARCAMYRKFRRYETGAGDDALVRLDGIPGLLFVLDTVGSDPERLEDMGPEFFLIRDAEEKCGIEVVSEALRDAARRRPAIAAALREIEDYSPDWTPDEIVRARNKRQERFRRNDAADLLGDDITWAQVKRHPRFDRIAMFWGRPDVAPDEEIEAAARDVPPDDDVEFLKSYLRIFWKREFPLHPKPLIRLVDHPDEAVAWRALSALEIVRHEEARRLFFRLLEHPKWSYGAIGMLRRNYRAGDSEHIEPLLARLVDDLDGLHVAGIDVRQVYEENPLPEGLKALEFVYEYGPCAMCRYGAVKLISEIGEVPRWMLEECRYDSDPDTRALAERLLST